ncbi:MAG: tetraacyldisaccharide 4'-kinase [Saprospiraceae bacterium]|nr:tetraacyldisaccharide 4'-kinase [Saprospiraceae bacterium]
MIQSILGKILMAPFSFLYGLTIGIRNTLYDSELVKSTTFSLPIISVGNLSIGGAGKTPHIEYLIRLLSPYINVSTLSRGYKRKTKGFRFIRPNDSVLDAGDEPLMYARKHRNAVVAVGESRAIAIPQMVGKYPNLQTVLLDDAFQHRSIKPALNILLTTWDEPFTRDYLLPSGRLREWRSAYKRADIIIVSKCPKEISFEEKSLMIQEINPQNHQKIFFSYYEYGYPYNFYNPKQRIKLDKKLDVILISAIANTSYLLAYLDEEVEDIHHMNYEDHHLFSEIDIDYIHTVFTHREAKRKLILTTEKDAMRLDLHRAKLKELGIPVFVLPMQVKFHDDQETFDHDIKDFLLKYRS